jgi:uncharacterized protein (DUF4415 family)
VLLDPLAVTIEDSAALDELRWITVGANSLGSLTVVVWTERGEEIREYDFSTGKRGAVISSRGKTRTTIYLDNEVLGRFKMAAERLGKGYQTLINDALGAHQGTAENPLTATQVREILREELASRTGS